MKYSDIISLDNIVYKLKMVSFKNPKKNLAMYKFINSILPALDYINSERDKIIEQVGHRLQGKQYVASEEIELIKFKDLFEPMLALDIPDKIIVPDISENDFDDGECKYSPDNRLWLNANELEIFFTFLNKAKEERNDKNV